MKNNLITLVSTIIAAILLCVFWKFELVRYLPGERYTGWQTVGYAVYIYAEAYIGIPLLMGVLGFYLEKEKRWKQFWCSLFIALIFMILLMFILGKLEKWEQERARAGSRQQVSMISAD